MTHGITVTEHTKAEWSRLAQAAYASDRNALGHRFSGAASIKIGTVLSCAVYDALQDDYRKWLIDGFAALESPSCDYASSETAYGRTVAYPFSLKVF